MPTLMHLYPLTGAALVGLGLYGIVTLRHPLRQLLAVNVVGAGIFLILGGLGRGTASTDPFPQALVITGIVVAFSATTLAVALLQRLFELTGEARLDDEPGEAERRSEP